jgi:hypothetical protein
MKSCVVNRLVMLFAAAYILQSCSVVRRLEVDDATWNCIGSGQHYCHDTIVRTNIWKGKNNVKISAGCDNGISRVKVTTKPGDIILGAFTLGFVVRQRIEWDCAQSSGSTDM